MTRQIAPSWGRPSPADLEERILRLEERVLRLEAQVGLLTRVVERLAGPLDAHDTTGDTR